MDPQALFYSLGIIYFFISLVIIIVLTVVFLSYYLKAKKQLQGLKDSYAGVVRLKEMSGKLPPLIISVVTLLLGLLIKKLKNRDKA